MSQPLKLEQRMSLKRDQGLAQPIPETNVGHRLLKKMGYVYVHDCSQTMTLTLATKCFAMLYYKPVRRAGTGLGKQASGMAQPLPVDLKAGTQ